VFLVNVVIKSDNIVGRVGVHVVKDFNGNIFHIVTSPSIWTFWTFHWGWTEEMFKVFKFTVIISPVVFSFDNTSEEFTLVNSSRTVIITIINEVNDFNSGDILDVNSTISIGIIFIPSHVSIFKSSTTIEVTTV